MATLLNFVDIPDAIDLSEPHIVALAEPTAKLRWRNGVLEQAFAMKHYGPHGVCHVSTDWRPVPTEE